MHFTAQSKKSAGTLALNQIVLVFALLIALVGQVSALPTAGGFGIPFGTDRAHAS